MTIQCNELPTQTENKKLNELFLAIYFNDLKKVIEFKEYYPKLYAKKDKFLVDEYTTFDLINLTFFNQIIWFDDGWTDKISPFVVKQRKYTTQMLDFWRTEFKNPKIHRQIEYNQYQYYFFCEDPKDFEEIIIEPISTYLKKGFREIDLKLYNRAQCFDFVEVKKLLEQGAKTNIHFENDGDSSIYMRISDEVSFLATCQVIPEFKVFEAEGYNQNFDIVQMFGSLLGLAAHQEMLHLLNKYDDEE